MIGGLTRFLQVIACTENRVLIWNLLTLRLQTVLKLSAEHIAVDSQTNLISVFTKNQECKFQRFIFREILLFFYIIHSVCISPKCKPATIL